jgi:hypothetical protein
MIIKPNLSSISTLIICIGSALIFLIQPTTSDNVELFGIVAWELLLVLLLATYVEAGNNIANYFRSDILLIWIIYFLTFFEFLFSNVELMLIEFRYAGGEAAVNCTLLGLCAIAIGRHFTLQAGNSAGRYPGIDETIIFRVLISFWIAGFLIVLYSVQLDPIKLVNGLLGSRWEKPWARGSSGSLLSVIEQLKLLHYAVPAFAGYLLATSRYAGRQIAATLMFVTILVFAFTEGTRSVFLIYCTIFLASYVLNSNRASAGRRLIIVALMLPIMAYGTYLMLELRAIGLGAYLENRGVQPNKGEEFSSMVDNNLLAIAGITEVFPSRHDYLGPEILFRAITLPIPRALWAGKPDRLSIETNEALSMTGLSLSSTVIGEGYIAAGQVGVCMFGLIFGAAAGWWNRKYSDDDIFAKLIYVCGFFAIAISARSVIFSATAVLPVLALVKAGNHMKRKTRVDVQVARSGSCSRTTSSRPR